MAKNEKPAAKPAQPKQTVMFKSENILTLSPKTIPFNAFHLKNLNPESIKDMIQVLGKSPKVKFSELGELEMFYSNKLPVLFANCVINYDGEKNIIWIKPYTDVEHLFNILK